jgi:hypothetical protein
MTKLCIYTHLALVFLVEPISCCASSVQKIAVLKRRHFIGQVLGPWPEHLPKHRVHQQPRQSLTSTNEPLDLHNTNQPFVKIKPTF